jgi:hypothetical protein
MTGQNVAFHKKLIGPAMAFFSLSNQSDLYHDGDLVAGWISKVIADHLQWGVKIGSASVHVANLREGGSSSDESVLVSSLVKEASAMNILSEERLVKFLSDVTLSKHSDTAAKAYLELSEKMESSFKDIDPHIVRLTQAMRVWIDLWDMRFGGDLGTHDCYNASQHQINANNVNCLPKILPIASKSTDGPKPYAPEGTNNEKGTTDDICAVFTVSHNEATLLPIWVKYYVSQVGAENVWILDHNTDDGSTDLDRLPKSVHVKRLYSTSEGEDINLYLPHYFINRQVELHQQRLFRFGYRCVLFAEVDELVIPDPNNYPNGLREYFKAAGTRPESVLSRQGFVCVNAYQLAHLPSMERAIDLTKPLLSQRVYWIRDDFFFKPLLSKVPLRYTTGHHNAFLLPYPGATEAMMTNKSHIDIDLVMIHLHAMDFSLCREREEMKFNASRLKHRSDEDGLGMNSWANKPGTSQGTFESLLKQFDICGPSMISENLTIPVNEIVDPYIVEKIPEHFRSVNL